MTTTVTSTIRSSGGNYTSLSAWFSAKQKNCVTADEIHVAECYNDWGSGLDDNVTLTGATTDSTHYYKITVASGHRHTGTPQTGFYLKKSHSSSGIIRLDQAYTYVEWLDVEQTNTADDVRAFITTTVSGLTLRNCIGKSVSGAGGAAFDVTGATCLCCLAWSSTRSGFVAYNNTTLYNCVSANNRFGIYQSSATPTIKNFVSYSNTYNYYGITETNCSHNATSTGSDDAPGGNSVYGIASGNFVNAASNNFHLAAGTNSLVGAGTNLYSTFTTDIDGETWPSSAAWDIGFEYRDAAGGATYDGAVSETLAATSTQGPAVDWLGAAAESIATTTAQGNTLIADVTATMTLAVTTTEAGALDTTQTIAEALAVVTAQAQDGAITMTVSETIAATSAEAGIWSGSAAVTESAALTSSESAVATFAVSVGEAIAAVVAQWVAGATVDASVSESLAATTTLSATVELGGIVAETLAATDAVGVISTETGSVTMALAIADAAIGGLVSTLAVTEAVSISTSADGSVITAEFVTPDGRTLRVSFDARTLEVRKQPRTLLVSKSLH